ncbi:hypothetical protein [Pantoea sp. 1.19]|uniref:hypothetical protein n=1 Tax=Pantoea sp. 1.19 TaxID=1925589 RepID=UPI000948A2E2|nr:hypothetical protein [Pantoea sp. 1.19]
MLSPEASCALRSVTELHQWIAAVFNGAEDADASLEKLAVSFHPDFLMVTTAGATVGLSEVLALFHRRRGARPGLQITIDCGDILQQSASHVVCRYRETHCDPTGESSRWSLAMIDVAGGQPRWRYLQETAIASVHG